jgi:hypothetical protein
MKPKSISRQVVQYIACLLLFSVILFSCKKDVDVPEQQTPVAGLMAFNLMPDQQSMGIDLAPNRLTNNPLGYTNYTGGYSGVYTGNRNIISYDFYSGTSFSSTTFNFEDSSYYSLFVVGSNGNYENLIVKDNLDSLPAGSGKAFVRFVNAIPDSTKNTMVSISGNNMGIINEDAMFKTVSDFSLTDAGDITVKATSSDVDVNRTFRLEANKVYTILVVGIPGATDPAQAVQIKYILNGEVS